MHELFYDDAKCACITFVRWRTTTGGDGNGFDENPTSFALNLIRMCQHILSGEFTWCFCRIFLFLDIFGVYVLRRFACYFRVLFARTSFSLHFMIVSWFSVRRTHPPPTMTVVANPIILGIVLKVSTRNCQNKELLSLHRSQDATRIYSAFTAKYLNFRWYFECQRREWFY